MSRKCLVLFVFFLSCGRVAEQHAPVFPDIASTDPVMQEKAVALAKNFQGAFLIARGGKVLAARGMGLANHVSGELNNTQTSLRLASCSKPITAVAVMQLVEEGTLSLSAPVSRYLPDYGDNGSRITLHQLLTHTSGLPNYTDFVDVVTNVDQIIASFKSRPFKFTPGSRFEYSNSNYALLGYLVARVSGIPYDRYLQDKIFIPLQMENSGFDFPVHPGPGFAAPSGGNPNAPFEDNLTAYASGALYSSVVDMYYLFHALNRGTLLKPETVKLMQQKQAFSWGYGFSIEPGGWVSHNGEVSGFTSQLYSHAASETFLIVLSNGHTEAWTLADRLKGLVD